LSKKKAIEQKGIIAATQISRDRDEKMKKLKTSAH